MILHYQFQIEVGIFTVRHMLGRMRTLIPPNDEAATGTRSKVANIFEVGSGSLFRLFHLPEGQQ